MSMLRVGDRVTCESWDEAGEVSTIAAILPASGEIGRYNFALKRAEIIEG